LDHRARLEEIARRLAGRRRRELAIPGFRPAAVLLGLLERQGDAVVPMIVRPEGMRAHSGQIALPGGVRDPQDESLVATALREAEEELGIAPDQVRPLGMLDDVPTPTGFVITPVVAEIAGPCCYAANPDEVAEVFEAPLDLFADPAHAEDMGERRAMGMVYRLRAYPFEGRRIWGATARVMESLFELLRAG